MDDWANDLPMKIEESIPSVKMYLFFMVYLFKLSMTKSIHLISRVNSQTIQQHTCVRIFRHSCRCETYFQLIFDLSIMKSNVSG